MKISIINIMILKNTINNAKLNEYLIIAVITKNMDDIEILKNLGLFIKGGGKKRMLNVGVLFFSKHIYILLEQVTITSAVFEGIERAHVINRLELRIRAYCLKG